ncbi:MAG: hypothetical protein KIT22_00855 [Verrucomicrobiae bacterium]|nr:hypothetical protein [Verrucomicrobiae bacterium]
MSATVTPRSPSKSRPARGDAAAAASAGKPKPAWQRWIAPISSLRLTVLLLALSIIVTFFGTLAQTEDGLYVAQQRYFRSWFSVWSPHNPDWKWLQIPLPGGYLLGVLLLVNLITSLTKFTLITALNASNCILNVTQ